MFKWLKKAKKREEILKTTSMDIENDIIRESTERANIAYSKPQYSPQTRKQYYDNPAAHQKAKEIAFSKNSTVRDQYSGAELAKTKSDAKAIYGDKWQDHLAEADHIDPLNKIVKRHKNDPFVGTEDIKEVANSQDNYQVVSRSTNQTGGKGGSSQDEWSRDLSKMQKLEEQSGRAAKDIAAEVREIGRKAESLNDTKLKKVALKNGVKTFHSAGASAALNTAGTTAIISTYYNIAAVADGEKTKAEAITDIGATSLRMGGSAYLKAGAITTINHALSSSENSILHVAGNSNVLGKAATVISITGKSFKEWGNDEITTEEFVDAVSENGISYFGGVIGKVVLSGIPCGRILGSLIGGAVARELYTDIRAEMRSKKEAELRRQREAWEAFLKEWKEKQRQEEVRALIRTNTEAAVEYSVYTIMTSAEFKRMICEIASFFIDIENSKRRIAELAVVTLQVQEFREKLQESIQNNFRGYEYCFMPIMDSIKASLTMEDYDTAIEGANQLTELFGKDPVIKNTEDFKKKFFGNEKIYF